MVSHKLAQSFAHAADAMPTKAAAHTAASRAVTARAAMTNAAPTPRRELASGRSRPCTIGPRRLSFLAALLVVLLAAAPCGSRADEGAGPLDLERLAEGRLGPGPAGWVSYCLGRPADCLEAVPPARVPWSGAIPDLVAKVQREVNAAIEPVPEPASRDLWALAPRAGDCEDFALTKREVLRAAGLPAGALRLATAYTERGEYHTVLTVQTERGAVVLDNRFAEVRPLADLPYRWVMVELPDRPFAWAHL